MRVLARPTRQLVDEPLLDAHLPDWDYADAYEVSADTDGVQARDVAQVLLRPDRAGRAVLGLRDRAVRPFRVASVASTGGDLFPVLAQDAGLVVLGLDDRHLDFRVLIQVEPGTVRCTTAVRRHNALGRLYFVVVGPFHRRLVPHLLSRLHRHRPGCPTPAGQE